MVAPLVALGVAYLGLTVAQSLYNVYNTDRSTKLSDDYYNYTSDYNLGAMYENQNYWQNYLKAHHIQNRDIKYPYRTGYYYNASTLYSARAGFETNNYARQSAWVTGGINAARSGAGLGFAHYKQPGYKKTNYTPSNMYA